MCLCVLLLVLGITEFHMWLGFVLLCVTGNILGLPAVFCMLMVVMCVLYVLLTAVCVSGFVVFC